MFLFYLGKKETLIVVVVLVCAGPLFGQRMYWEADVVVKRGRSFDTLVWRKKTTLCLMLLLHVMMIPLGYGNQNREARALMSWI